MLAGLTEARDDGTDEVAGTPCRRLAVSVDGVKASRETPDGLTVPVLGGCPTTFEQLQSLPVEAWVDEEHLRRVRFATATTTEIVELRDFGVPVDELDWTRLPTFRSG